MILVATEDRLSEAAAAKVIKTTVGADIEMRLIRGGGSGYLRSRLPRFIRAAEKFPFVLLTDLDKAKCAPTLIGSWLHGRTMPRRLKFRVAVREVEAWLLADREAVSTFLAIAPHKIDANPENIGDPKRYLLTLAQKAPKSIRSELLPSKGSRALRGFGYNDCLCKFVADRWSPRRAAEASPSLRKAIERIAEFRTAA